MRRQCRSRYPGPEFWIFIMQKALALPGVLAVLTAEDVPNNKVGHLQQDWDVMIAKGSITRCVGDAICLVVAETRNTLEKAKKLVKVEYEELKPVTNVHEAMAPGCAESPFKRQSVPEPPCDKRRREKSSGRVEICGNSEIYHAIYRACVPGT